MYNYRILKDENEIILVDRREGGIAWLSHILRSEVPEIALSTNFTTLNCQSVISVGNIFMLMKLWQLRWIYFSNKFLLALSTEDRCFRDFIIFTRTNTSDIFESKLLSLLEHHFYHCSIGPVVAIHTISQCQCEDYSQDNKNYENSLGKFS